MSNEQTFDVDVKGSSYLVDVGLTTFSVMSGDVVNGVCGTRIIERSSGGCNPLVDLWGSRKYRSVHGAARDSMEHKCIRDAVALSIEQHQEFCLQEAFGDRS